MSSIQTEHVQRTNDRHCVEISTIYHGIEMYFSTFFEKEEI
jgi:hypothetical protein